MHAVQHFQPAAAQQTRNRSTAACHTQIFCVYIIAYIYTVEQHLLAPVHSVANIYLLMP